MLILSVDATLAGLLRVNLERRGFGVRHQAWAACCGVGEAAPRDAKPGEAAPGEATPPDATPGEAAPGGAATSDAARGGTATSDATRREAAPGDATPGEAAAGGAAPEDAHVLVADLDCPPPACWHGARRVRALFPTHPLVLLGHDWPDGQLMAACRPCRYLQKPFAIGEFMHAVAELVQPQSGGGTR